MANLCCSNKKSRSLKVGPNEISRMAVEATEAFEASQLSLLCLHVQALSRLAPLLRVDAYRAAVLEGMVACIGGLDGHLSKEATAALTQQSHCDDADTAGEMTTTFSRIIT